MIEGAVQIVIKAIDKSKDGFNTSIDSIKSLEGALNKIAPAGKFAFLALQTAIIAGIKSSMDYASEMDSLAKKTGLTVEQTSKLSYALSKFGFDSNKVADSFKDFNAAIIDAANGTGNGANAFRTLGISVVDAGGKLKSSNGLLSEVANAFGKITDPAVRSKVAIELFQGSGMAMLPVLAKGADGLLELETAADKAGATIDDDLVANVKAFKSIMGESTLELKGFFISLTSEIMPAIIEVAKTFMDFKGNSEETKFVLEALSFTIKVLAAGVIVTGSAFRELGMVIGQASYAASEAAQLHFKAAKDAMANLSNDLEKQSTETEIRLANLFIPEKVAKPAAATAKAASDAFDKNLKPEDFAKAAARAIDAANTASAATIKAGGKAELSILDAQYSNKIVDLGTYLAKKNELIQKDMQAEIELAKTKAGNAKGMMGRNGNKDSIEYQNALAEFNKYDGEVKDKTSSLEAWKTQSAIDGDAKRLAEQKATQDRKYAVMEAEKSYSAAAIQQTQQVAQAAYDQDRMDLQTYLASKRTALEKEQALEVQLERQKISNLEALRNKTQAGTPARDEADQAVKRENIKLNEILLNQKTQLNALDSAATVELENQAQRYRDLQTQATQDQATADARLATLDREVSYRRSAYQDTMDQIRNQRAAEQAEYNSKIANLKTMKLTEDQFRAQKAAADKTLRTNTAALDRQEVLAKRQNMQLVLTGTSEMLGNMAGIAQAFGKKGFAAYKAFASAKAVIDAIQGATRAYADYPWPLNLAVSATMLGLGMANVAQINSQQPSGQAHNGMEYVPREGSYILDDGERVVQRNQNEKLGQFLDKPTEYIGGGSTGSSGEGSSGVINVSIEGSTLCQLLYKVSKSGQLKIHPRAVTPLYS